MDQEYKRKMNEMKKLIIFLIGIFCFISNTYSQYFNLGLKSELNYVRSNDHYFDDFKTGGSIGLVTKFNTSRFFAIQPELTLSLYNRWEDFGIELPSYFIIQSNYKAKVNLHFGVGPSIEYISNGSYSSKLHYYHYTNDMIQFGINSQLGITMKRKSQINIKYKYIYYTSEYKINKEIISIGYTYLF